MEKNDEILLQELNEILPVGVKDLRTPEEKNAEIDRIIDIWSNLSENAQTEELFFKVVERTKNSWSGRYSIKNPKNVLKVYDGTSEHLKNRDTYVRLISLIQKDFLMSEIKELYDRPYRPFDFETEQDYFGMTVVFEDYWNLTDFIEKYVPENVRTQEFYQNIFQNQNDFEKGYGGNAVDFWNTIPENVKNQELFVELCRRIRLAEIKKLFKIIPEDYINEELLKELPDIFKYKTLIPEYANEILGRIPEELKNQEFYSLLMSKLYYPEERLLAEYEIIRAYVGIVPAKYKTVNMFGNVIRHVGTTQITNILDNTPDEIKTQEFYIEFMKVFAESQTIRDLTGYNLYAKILRKIPTEYFTEENILLMLSQKKDKPKDGVGLLKTVEKFCKEELSSLYPNGFSKDFYTQLIENNLEDEIFSIFNSMPDKYKTEEMYLKSIEKNKDNTEINLHLIFILSRRLSKDKNLSKTFSKDFYEQLIYSTDDATHIIDIIREMPDEYKTEDLYIKFITRYKEDDKINAIISGIPEKLKTEGMYRRIIEETKTVKNENGQIRGNNQKILEKIIRAIPEEIRNKEEVIDSFSNFLDENGNTIYTPANLLYLYRQPFNYKYRPYIEKKLLQILNIELERVEKIITSESNIEDEINKIQGIDMGVEQSTFIHGLNIIFEVIPKDIIPEELKRKYYLTIKQSIVKLENEHNRKVIEILPQMFESNDELFASLDKRFIESDKYINSLGVEKFEILALYPKIQKEIVKLDDVQLNIFSNILNYIAEKNIGDEVQEDWISMTEKIWVNIRNPEFEKLIKSLQSVAPADLSDTMKENLSSILSKKINYFDIDELEQLESYKDISKRTCLQILRNPEDNNLNKKIKRIPKNERVKFAKLQLLFGIDIQEANFLIEKYGYEITDEMAKDEAFNCLKKIKEMIETENVEDLLVQSEDDSNETRQKSFNKHGIFT